MMISKPVLTSDDVKRIAAAAEAEALKNGWAVTIAIVDDGGHLLGCSDWTVRRRSRRTSLRPRRAPPRSAGARAASTRK